MSLESLSKFAKLQGHKTSPEEIKNLFEVSARCLKDASQTNISLDLRFISAYQAALAVAEALLYCHGCKAPKSNYHFMTWEAMRNIDDAYIKKTVMLFDDARKKRGVAFYDHADIVSEIELKELFKEAKVFVEYMRDKIKKDFPIFGKRI
jgi:uncharacterized protein (UPF0332 family)